MSQVTVQDVTNFNEQEIEMLIRFRQHRRLFDELKIAPNHIFPDTGNGMIHLSVTHGGTGFTKILITSGCNVNVQNRLGNTALVDAVLQERPLHVKLLLEAKSDIRLTNANGDTALKLALKSVDTPIKLVIMKYFLHYVKSTVTSKEEMVKLLKKANCSLVCAVYLKDIDVIKVMLKQGHDINENNFYHRWTALHAAVATNNNEMIRLLVQHGCDLSIADHYGHLPLILMLNHTAVQCPETIKALMPASMDWTECYPAGWMKLRSVFAMGTKETLRLFLQSYNVNLTAKDKKGMTPLHYLVSNGKDGIFDLCQNLDFNIDACDKTFNKTALHIAATQGSVAAVKFLLDKDADVNAADFLGRTPLFYTLARESRRDSEYKECIELLVEHGTNLQAVTFERETVFGVASNCQNYFLAEPLLAHLAIIDAAGKPIERLVLDQITSDRHLEKRYDSCKLELQKMKMQSVYGTVTLLKFLIYNVTKVALYTRRKELFNRSMHAYSVSDSYYFSLLRQRFDKAMEIDALRTKAALVLNESIILLECNDIIINRIIACLSYKDLLKFD